MHLKDKVIIITGGSGLLGKAIINYLVQNNALVINADVANAVNNKKVIFIETDITNTNSVKRLLDTVAGKYENIDGFVNNAYPRTTDWGNKFEAIEIESWKKNIDLQLNSVFYTCQQVFELMKTSGGSIVNIASIYGIVGPDFSVYDNTQMTMPAAYSAIKGGIINFTKYLASYSGKFNIRVNCVSPGGIFDNQPLSFVNNYQKKVPLGRLGTPDDIAPAVAFLLADESKYITGHNLVVDGGWTAI